MARIRALLPARSPQPDGVAPGLQEQAFVEGGVGARRLKMARRQPGELVDVALAGKVLEGWIANRHQTLFPLSINFRRLTPDEIALLSSMLAIALGASGIAPASGLPQLRGWLRTVGAEDTVADRVESLLAAPPALAPLLARIEHTRLAPYAYSISLATIDQRNQANRLFLDYLAARLSIPSDMARSLAQRFRS